MRNFYILLLLTLSFSFYGQTTFDFQTAQDLQGFTVTGQINANENISFGQEGMTITWDGPDSENGAPNGRKPQLRHIDANVDASTEKILALTINNTSNGAVDRFRIIHIKGNNPDVATVDVNSYDGSTVNRYAGFDIEGSTDGFKTYYFNLQNPAWANYTNDSETDDVTNSVVDFDHFRLQFLKDSGSNANDWVTQPGSLTIQKIEFISSVPAIQRVDYNFDEDTEGFIGRNFTTASQSAGQLVLDMGSNLYPKVEQSGVYEVDADVYKYATFYVSENNSPKTRINLVTPGEGGNQSVGANMNPNTTSTQILQYDLSAVSNWTGLKNNFFFQVIEQEFDQNGVPTVVDSGGELKIDRILFSTAPILIEKHDYTFENGTEGFIGANGVTVSQSAGQLVLDMSPSSYSRLNKTELYAVNADLYKYVRIIVSENNSTKSRMTVVSPDSEGENTFVAANMSPNTTDSQILDFDMSETASWSGLKNDFGFQIIEPGGTDDEGNFLPPLVTGGELKIDQILFSQTPLSVNQFSLEQKLKVFPNPAKDILNIHSASAVRTLRVLNVLGQEVLRQSGAARAINLSSLTPGLYILKTEHNNGGKATRKFIIQ
jgi:hypothetical protein